MTEQEAKKFAAMAYENAAANAEALADLPEIKSMSGPDALKFFASTCRDCIESYRL